MRPPSRCRGSQHKGGATDLYEQLVEMYLTVFDHLAIVPQFPVLFGEEGRLRLQETPGRLEWAAFPDFLAIDTRHRRAQIVEVNKSPYPNQVSNLATRALANRTRVEEYVRWFTPDSSQLHWRFFVCRKLVDRLKIKLEAGGLEAAITSLEDVFDWARDVMP